jgi:hypothetical protein
MNHGLPKHHGRSKQQSEPPTMFEALRAPFLSPFDGSFTVAGAAGF